MGVVKRFHLVPQEGDLCHIEEAKAIRLLSGQYPKGINCMLVLSISLTEARGSFGLSRF